jgi:ribosomal protein S12 methylthiotransferase accessory factor YcaO
MRALSEAVQSRLTMISGSRDDLFHRAYDELGDLDNLARAWRDWPACGEGERFAARAALDTASFEGDVAVLVARLRAAGVSSATVVDLSRAELGVPVVKLVIAGLEGHCLGAGYRRGARAAARGARP